MLNSMRLMALPLLAGIASFVATAGVYHTKFDTPLHIGASARVAAPGGKAKLFEASVLCHNSLKRHVEFEAVDQPDARATLLMRLPDCAIETLSAGIPITLG